MIQHRGALVSTSDGQVWFHTTPDQVRHLDTTSDGRNSWIISILLDAWMCLLADSPTCKLDNGAKPLRVYVKFRKWILSGPLRDRIKHLSTLADHLMKTGMTVSGPITGEFCTDMLHTPVAKEYIAWYKTGDPLLLKFLLSFLLFGKKLDFEDPEMNATAFRGWLEVERRLSCLSLPQGHVSNLKRIMEGLIGHFRLDKELKPVFGPGAVSEPGIRGDIRKSNAVLMHPKIDRLFFRSPQLVMRGTDEDGYHPDKVLPDPEGWHKANRISTDVSTLRFVPKDVTKARSICMEPNTFMWAQQAVLANILWYMRNGPVSQFVQLEDQSRNRQLAEWGSLTGEIDTIDLSSASDSVHSELVRAIMPRKLRYALFGCRTSKVRLPDGAVMEVKKFAPMGSAVCFPTQCLIFTAVSILAALYEAEGRAEGDDSPIGDRWFPNFGDSLRRLFAGEPGYHYDRGRFQPLAIYGDDIAVDCRLTPTIIYLLTSLGFSVNVEKSFTDEQAFRESCGGFYHRGEDVTPLRFSIKRIRDGNPSSCVASTVSLANRAGDFGYRHLQRYLIHLALSLEGNIPFTSSRDASLAFYSVNPRNEHLRRRYNAAYQREEMRCAVLLPKSVRRPRRTEKDAYESYRRVKWWVGHAGNSNTSEFSFGVPQRDTSGTRVGRRWTPVDQ